MTVQCGPVREIEVKILGVNRRQIEASLASLGAQRVFDGEIETLFFDFENGAILKARNLLRLRKEEETIELTYKKVHETSATKVAEEYSVEVSNLETMKAILGFLGLSVTESMRKQRVSYKLEHARFDIDKYEGKYDYIPEFLEIEAESAESIHKYAGLLGFESKYCLPWSTQDLINYYSVEKSK
jgi:adenylate cyclase, class 2